MSEGCVYFTVSVRTAMSEGCVYFTVSVRTAMSEGCVYFTVSVRTAMSEGCVYFTVSVRTTCEIKLTQVLLKMQHFLVELSLSEMSEVSTQQEIWVH
jgi:hypothetical protein